MSSNESKIKHLIRGFLLDENILREKITDPKLDFGFQFIYPPGKDSLGHEIGKNMVVISPKNKDLMIISLGIQISKLHINFLNNLENGEKMTFFMDLRKIFLLKDMFYRLDVKNYRYEISDQVFFDNESDISKKSFFKSIRKVFNCATYSNIILEEYCIGEVRPEDSISSKDFNSGSGFSLYS